MTILISINGPDRPGLVSAIAGRLFDLGFNLGDTNFAVLGTGFEFDTVTEPPADMALADIEKALSSIDELADCAVTVAPFDHEATHDETGVATHSIGFRGGDQPGLLARLAEVLSDFDANIVRLNAERLPGAQGHRYLTTCAIAIPADRATACLAALANTAGQMQPTCDWQAL